MVRKVTAKQDECVIITTGALATSSATSNIDNFLLLSMDSTRGPQRKKRRGEEGRAHRQLQAIRQQESECIIYACKH